jgi:Reverse transcriptase (RNA-dependent DNA polymerase)
MDAHSKTIANTFFRGNRRYYVPISSRSLQRTEYVNSPLERYRDRILKKWKYPDYMFDVTPGGHISALKKHLKNTYFAVIDLKMFYESISDTKVYRSLRSIGLPHSEAFKLTGESTVSDGKKMHLPRGFHQSAILASLVFDRSLLGSHIRSGKVKSHVSVYNDDIIISSLQIGLLRVDFTKIVSAAEHSNFKINTRKTQVPSKSIEVFNLILSKKEIMFTEQRLRKFAAEMNSLKEWCKRNQRDYFSELAHLHKDYIARASGSLIESVAIPKSV